MVHMKLDFGVHAQFRCISYAIIIIDTNPLKIYLIKLCIYLFQLTML